MTEEKKKELFPFFAYLYSQQLNPEKYGATSSIEEWSQLLKENEEDINAIVQSAENMSDEEWANIEKQYSATQASDSAEQTMYAKKGAKLKKLSAMKSKKCKCGCAMITAKEEGGKLSMKCSCGCSMKKKEEGGKMEPKKEKADNPKLAKLQKLKKHKDGGKVKKLLPGGYVRSYDYDWNQSMFNKSPNRSQQVSTTRALDKFRDIATQAARSNMQGTILPDVIITAPRITKEEPPKATSQVPANIPTAKEQSNELQKTQTNSAQTATAAVAEPTYDTNTLWGWMSKTGGMDASFKGRSALWNKIFGSGTTGAQRYLGTAEQNNRLLEALKKSHAYGVDAASMANLAPIKNKSNIAITLNKPQLKM